MDSPNYQHRQWHSRGLNFESLFPARSFNDLGQVVLGEMSLDRLSGVGKGRASVRSPDDFDDSKACRLRRFVQNRAADKTTPPPPPPPLFVALGA